jgi:hypothetical protein
MARKQTIASRGLVIHQFGAETVLSAKTLDACCRRHDDHAVMPATAGIQQPSVPWHTALWRKPLLHEGIMTTSQLVNGNS